MARHTKLSGLSAALRVGIGKEREAGNGKLGGALGLSHGFVNREALDARQRVDRRARLRSFGEEQRPDQVMRAQGVLAHQAPRPLRLAVAARALGEIETGLALDLGLDRGEAGFDGAAVFDGHCGAPGEDGSFSRSATHTPAGAAVALEYHSAVAPASLTRSAHFGSSLCMKAAKSCGVPGFAMALKRIKFAFISTDCRPSLMARLRMSTTSRGVPAGATTPVQASCVKSGNPLSTRVGTVGNAGQRSARAMPSARTLASLTRG